MKTAAGGGATPKPGGSTAPKPGGGTPKVPGTGAGATPKARTTTQSPLAGARGVTSKPGATLKPGAPPKSGGVKPGGKTAPVKGGKRGKTPDPVPVVKPLTKEQIEKKRIKEEKARDAREAEERETAEREIVQAKEAKRAVIQESVQAGIQAKRQAETDMQDAVSQLRTEKNARLREERYAREMACAWPYKMRLHAAALEGDVAAARRFLAADTDESFNADQLDANLRWREDNQTPLHLAAVRGNPDMIRTLLSARAEVDALTNEGTTALMIASANGRCATVLLLLAAKADVNLADRRWRMPLHHAALNGEKRAARLLMRNGAEPMAKTKTQGWTALHLAAGCKHPDLQMVFLLLGGPDHYLDEPRPSEEERAVVVALKEEERDKTARTTTRLGSPEARAYSRSSSRMGMDAGSRGTTAGEEEEVNGRRGLENEEDWAEFAEVHVSDSTLIYKDALARLEKVYPPEWHYQDAAGLFKLVWARCPGVPLPPYWTELGALSNMNYTAMDEAQKETPVRKCLEAASLLENEWMERQGEEWEKATGLVREGDTSGEPKPREATRHRKRRRALVIGNCKGPGGVPAPTCKDDAAAVARHLRGLGFFVRHLEDASRGRMLQGIAEMRKEAEEADVQVFYFSGHARKVGDTNYLVPSEGARDHLDAGHKWPGRAVRIREEVLAPLQSQDGTLTFVILDVFRASPAVSAPAGAFRWHGGEGDWIKRIPAAFLPHIRPPGTAGSFVQQPDREAGPWATPQMEGTMQGLKANQWPLLAGASIHAEENLEEILGEDGSLVLIYSNDPGGELAPDDPVLLSPYTAALGHHLWNPGGGLNNCGGGYPMMLADIKSEVLFNTSGRQCPWMMITEGADRQFSFVAEEKKPPALPGGAQVARPGQLTPTAGSGTINSGATAVSKKILPRPVSAGMRL